MSKMSTIRSNHVRERVQFGRLWRLIFVRQLHAVIILQNSHGLFATAGEPSTCSLSVLAPFPPELAIKMHHRILVSCHDLFVKRFCLWSQKRLETGVLSANHTTPTA